MDISGRILPPERICGGLNAVFDAGAQADWTKSLRDKALLVSVQLDNWAIVYPYRSERETRNFCDMLPRVGRGMSFTIKAPTP